MTDFARLSIAIDSASAKTATKELEKLGAVGDVVTAKMRRLAAAIGSLSSLHSLSSISMEATALSVAIDGLNIAVNAVAQGIGYSGNQIAKFEAQLMSTEMYSIEACRVLANMVTANLELVNSYQSSSTAQESAINGAIFFNDALDTLNRSIQNTIAQMQQVLDLNTHFKDSYEQLLESFNRVESQLIEQEQSQARASQASQEHCNAILLLNAAYEGVQTIDKTKAIYQLGASLVDTGKIIIATTKSLMTLPTAATTANVAIGATAATTAGANVVLAATPPVAASASAGIIAVDEASTAASVGIALLTGGLNILVGLLAAGAVSWWTFHKAAKDEGGDALKSAREMVAEQSKQIKQQMEINRLFEIYKAGGMKNADAMAKARADVAEGIKKSQIEAVYDQVIGDVILRYNDGLTRASKLVNEYMNYMVLGKKHVDRSDYNTDTEYNKAYEIESSRIREHYLKNDPKFQAAKKEWSDLTREKITALRGESTLREWTEKNENIATLPLSVLPNDGQRHLGELKKESSLLDELRGKIENRTKTEIELFAERTKKRKEYSDLTATEKLEADALINTITENMRADENAKKVKIQLAEDERELQTAINAIKNAGLDIAKTELDTVEAEKNKLIEQITLLKKKKKLSDTNARLLIDKVNYDYSDDGKRKKGLEGDAKSLIRQHESPDDYHKRELTNLDDMLRLGLIGIDTYNKALDDLNRDTMRKLAESGNAWAIMGSTIQQSSQGVSNALVNWMNDVNGVGHSWVTLRDTVRSVIADMLIEMQKMLIQKAVMDPLFKMIGGFIGGLFTQAPVAQTTPMSTSGFMQPFQMVEWLDQFRASGGSVLSGSTYLVGERGPELFVSRTAGVIVPNNRLGGGGGAGGANVTIVQNISAGGSSTQTSGSGGGSQPWANMAKGIEGIVRETIRKEQRQGNSLNPVFPGRRG